MATTTSEVMKKTPKAISAMSMRSGFCVPPEAVMPAITPPITPSTAEKTSGPLTVVRRPPRAGRPDPARSADGRGDGALTAGLLTAGDGWGGTAHAGARG